MKNLYILSLVLTALLFSCDEPLCVFPKEPELANRQFPIGSTDNYYYVEVRAEINNEPRDDDYDYFFNVIGLPPGMDFFVNFRTISLEGTPQQSGTFEVTIFLEVDGPFRDFGNEPEALCNFATSKTYTLIIE